MGTTTPRGVYKYGATDAAPDAASLLNLAQDALDTLLAKLPRDVQTRTETVVIAAANTPVVTAITFDRPFANTPVVTATPSHSAAKCGVSDITTTGFTLRTERTSTTNVTVQIIAVGF